jgi:beta-lactam-binding protein with PASTA domain
VLLPTPTATYPAARLVDITGPTGGVAVAPPVPVPLPAPTTPPILSAGPRRPRRVGRITAIVVPVVLALAGVGAYVAWTPAPATSRVPDVVQQNVFAAAAALHKAGFEAEPRGADDPSPAGTVLGQSPAGGRTANKGSAVVITYSRTDATMPPVEGMALTDAQAALERVGLLSVSVTERDDGTVDPGTVLSSVPAAGQRAEKGQSVTLVVARDPHVHVPDVRYLSQSAAEQQLQAQGLEVWVQQASSNTVPAGAVISVSPSVGKVVLRGTVITLTVSTGPKRRGSS